MEGQAQFNGTEEGQTLADMEVKEEEVIAGNIESDYDTNDMFE